MILFYHTNNVLSDRKHRLSCSARQSTNSQHRTRQLAAGCSWWLAELPTNTITLQPLRSNYWLVTTLPWPRSRRLFSILERRTKFSWTSLFRNIWRLSLLTSCILHSTYKCWEILALLHLQVLSTL